VSALGARVDAAEEVTGRGELELERQRRRTVSEGDARSRVLDYPQHQRFGLDEGPVQAVGRLERGEMENVVGDSEVEGGHGDTVEDESVQGKGKGTGKRSRLRWKWLRGVFMRKA
jgi:hypothetical protein